MIQALAIIAWAIAAVIWMASAVAMMAATREYRRRSRELADTQGELAGILLAIHEGRIQVVERGEHGLRMEGEL